MRHTYIHSDNRVKPFLKPLFILSIDQDLDISQISMRMSDSTLRTNKIFHHNGFRASGRTPPPSHKPSDTLSSIFGGNRVPGGGQPFFSLARKALFSHVLAQKKISRQASCPHRTVNVLIGKINDPCLCIPYHNRPGGESCRRVTCLVAFTPIEPF